MELKIGDIVYEIKDGNVHLEIHDGKLVSFNYNDALFIQKAATKISTPTTSTTKPTQDELKELRGKVLATYGTNRVYENVYNDFMKTGKILAKYYPYSGKVSFDVYYSLYNRYHKNPNSKPVQKTNVQKRSYRRIPPPNSIAYSKTYGTYVKSDEYQKVKQLIYKFGFVSTMSSLIKETQYKSSRISAILDILKQKNEIVRSWENDTVVYHPKPTGNETV